MTNRNLDVVDVIRLQHASGEYDIMVIAFEVFHCNRNVIQSMLSNATKCVQNRMAINILKYSLSAMGGSNNQIQGMETPSLTDDYKSLSCILPLTVLSQ